MEKIIEKSNFANFTTLPLEVAMFWFTVNKIEKLFK